jgi:hypothetical protein
MDPLPPFAREGGDSSDSPPVLPVELISFEANYSNSSIVLNWSTASEINNQGFEVQRAMDNLNFKTIGFVNGNGNSNTIKNYSFTDKDINITGTYYYRLKQIDFDGKYEYSGIQTVKLEENKILFSAFPNPINGDNKLNYKIVSGNKFNSGIVNLYTTNGMLIYSMPINFHNSYSNQINLNGIKSGMYILEFKSKYQNLKEKIIVQ